MEKHGRPDELYRLISEIGYASVDYLAKKTFTSPSTIRRDLAELERSGLIIRRHGGAEVTGSTEWSPLDSRISRNHAAKLEIARKAASYVSGGMAIFIDASSTCLEMADFLPRSKRLTVFTNGLKLAALLGDSGIETHVIGGRIVPKSSAIAGEAAIIAAKQVYYDALFFSSNGYADEIVTDCSEPETQLRRVLIAQSEKKFFLCDRSKFGLRSTYVVCRSSEIDEIITE